MSDKVCPTCGAATVAYLHRMNRGLVRGLSALYLAGGGPTKLDPLALNYNERCNFQKLRYWGLVDNVGRGVWRLTDAGEAFVEGGAVPVCVKTYRHETVDKSMTEVTMSQVWEGYKLAPEWAQEAVAAGTLA